MHVSDGTNIKISTEATKNWKLSILDPDCFVSEGIFLIHVQGFFTHWHSDSLAFRQYVSRFEDRTVLNAKPTCPWERAITDVFFAEGTIQFSSHLQFASQTPSLHRSFTISVSISFAVCITDFIFWFHFTVSLEISSHLMFQPNFIPLMNSSWIFSSQTYLTSQTSSFDLIFQIKSIFAKLRFHKIHIYNDQHSSNSYSQ